MTIDLYNNTSEPIRADKNITLLLTTTGFLRTETSLLSPEIEIETSSEIIGKCNYAYIQEFGRFYFVGDPISIRNGIWALPMKVDVLTTYKDGIRNNYAIISRNENEYDLLLNDGIFVTQQKPRRAQFAFPAGFNTWNYVLAIAGN